MSPAAMTRVLELISEAEASLRESRPGPTDVGTARGCLTCVRAYVETAIEMEMERK